MFVEQTSAGEARRMFVRKKQTPPPGTAYKILTTGWERWVPARYSVNIYFNLIYLYLICISFVFLINLFFWGTHTDRRTHTQ